MGLCGEVVDLRWPDLANDLDEAVAVDQVAVVKDHFPSKVAFRVLVQMLQTHKEYLI